MILAGIIAGISVFLLFLIFLTVIYIVLRIKVKRFVTDFTTAPDEKTPSPLAALCVVIADIFGREISNSLKATFMGVSSVDSKNEKAIEAEMIASQSPMLSMIMAAFPMVAKRIRKNPALAGTALEVATKLFKGNGSGGGTPLKLNL